MQEPTHPPHPADGARTPSDTPGHRSGSGAESSREQMQRDEQRRKNPESDGVVRGGKPPVPGR